MHNMLSLIYKTGVKMKSGIKLKLNEDVFDRSTSKLTEIIGNSKEYLSDEDILNIISVDGLDALNILTSVKLKHFLLTSNKELLNYIVEFLWLDCNSKKRSQLSCVVVANPLLSSDQIKKFYDDYMKDLYSNKFLHGEPMIVSIFLNPNVSVELINEITLSLYVDCKLTSWRGNGRIVSSITQDSLIISDSRLTSDTIDLLLANYGKSYFSQEDIIDSIVSERDVIKLPSMVDELRPRELSESQLKVIIEKTGLAYECLAQVFEYNKSRLSDEQLNQCHIAFGVVEPFQSTQSKVSRSVVLEYLKSISSDELLSLIKDV